MSLLYDTHASILKFLSWFLRGVSSCRKKISLYFMFLLSLLLTSLGFLSLLEEACVSFPVFFSSMTDERFFFLYLCKFPLFLVSPPSFCSLNRISSPRNLLSSIGRKSLSFPPSRPRCRCCCFFVLKVQCFLVCLFS